MSAVNDLNTSSVNEQVTDAVSQINALLTGSAPSQSMGMLDVTGTETMGMSMFNAITAQQNAQTSASAATTASCAKMLNTEILPLKPVDLGSKEALQLALSKVNLAEDKLVGSLLLETLKKLIESKSSISKTSVMDAFHTAEEEVGKKIAKAEQALFDEAAKKLEKNIKGLFTTS